MDAEVGFDGAHYGVGAAAAELAGRLQFQYVSICFSRGNFNEDLPLYKLGHGTALLDHDYT